MSDTTGVATFDFDLFALRYPAFAGMYPPLAAQLFYEATAVLDNTPASPIRDLTRRLSLLNMLVAHLATLTLGPKGNGKAAAGVGRVSSASEGSVSVSFDWPAQGSDASAWYNQTQPGSQYWKATAPLRQARFVNAPSRRLRGGVGAGYLGFGRRF